MKLIDLTGQRFGRWTIIERSYPNGKSNQVMWLCKCDCGTEKIVIGDTLKRGVTKSCGCLQKELLGNRKRLKLGLSSIRAKISSYKARAKRLGIEYKLTEEQFARMTKQDCYYCGSKPSNKMDCNHYYGNYIYNGLDRVDNTKGYTIDNIVPCCRICNYAKQKMTLQGFESWIKRIYNRTIIRREKYERRK